MVWLVALGVGADLLGVIWLLQGTGMLRGSPMTGDPFWAAIGVVLMVVGTIIVAVSLLRQVPKGR